MKFRDIILQVTNVDQGDIPENVFLVPEGKWFDISWLKTFNNVRNILENTKYDKSFINYAPKM